MTEIETKRDESLASSTNKTVGAAPDLSGFPEELRKKHPLQYKWVLWYLKNDRTKQWEDCLKEVAEFDTIEDFWALFNNIQVASGLSWGSDYYFFKKGIQPMWEDNVNKPGGRWMIVVGCRFWFVGWGGLAACRVDKATRTQNLDNYWLELLMAMVGEQFEGLGAEICGAVMNIRAKGDKISMWIRDAQLGEADIMKMGRIMKEKLASKSTEVYRFEVHEETAYKNSSAIKPKFILDSD